MNSWHIGEILIQKRLIDWKQLEEALGGAEADPGVRRGSAGPKTVHPEVPSF